MSVTADAFSGFLRLIKSHYFWAPLFVAHATLAYQAQAQTQTEISDSVLDLETFIDEQIASYMEEEQAVGVTLALVREGEPVLIKGYGLADKATSTTVDPSHHLFRIGSVTKPFTAIAIAQLAEAGALDVDADVNDYLATFKIPDTHDGPVTLRSLLSHRPGFEDWSNFSYAGDPSEYKELGIHLAETVPERVRPAGVATSYSNWGFGLLGRVVENVSGQPWERYVEDNIFTTLGMDSSTARQPLGKAHPLNLQPELEERLATIYLIDEDGHREWRNELVLNAPAGSLVTSAEDMGRFLAAMLNGGANQRGRILSQEALEGMWVPAFPGRPGQDFGFGFQLGSLGSYATVGHGGAIGNLRSTLLFVPETKLGIFMSSNGAKSTQAAPARAILGRLLGDPKPEVFPVRELSDEAAERFVGAYLSTRRTYSDARKLFGLLDNPVTVTAPGDGGIRVQGGAKRDEGHYRAISDRGFQHQTSGRTVAFDLDDEGNAIRYYDSDASTARERLRLLEDRRLMAVLFVAALVFALLRLGSPVYWKIRGHGRSREPRLYDRISLISSLLVIAVAGSFLLTMFSAFSLGRDLWHSWPPPYFTTFLTVILLLVTSSVVQAACTIPILREGVGSSVWRFTALGFSGCLLLLALLFNVYNLLGYRV